MSKIITSEKITPLVEGLFSCLVRDRSGQIVEEIHEKNMIVFSSKEILALLVGNQATGNSVTRVAFGTNAAAATPADTQIGGVLTTTLTDGLNTVSGEDIAFVRPIDEIVFPEYNKVTFNWSLGYSEGNGLVITEYALLTNSGRMFSRKARGAIAKDADLSIEGSWTLVF